MLAEQNEDDAIRENLLKLVRAWLAAANELEKAASNILARYLALLLNHEYILSFPSGLALAGMSGS